MQAQLQNENKTTSKMQEDLLQKSKQIQSALQTVTDFTPHFKFTHVSLAMLKPCLLQQLYWSSEDDIRLQATPYKVSHFN